MEALPTNNVSCKRIYSEMMAIVPNTSLKRQNSWGNGVDFQRINILWSSFLFLELLNIPDFAVYMLKEIKCVIQAEIIKIIDDINVVDHIMTM